MRLVSGLVPYFCQIYRVTDKSIISKLIDKTRLTESFRCFCKTLCKLQIAIAVIKSVVKFASGQRSLNWFLPLPRG